jgi:hypothetical protein
MIEHQQQARQGCIGMVPNHLQKRLGLHVGIGMPKIVEQLIEGASAGARSHREVVAARGRGPEGAVNKKKGEA